MVHICTAILERCGETAPSRNPLFRPRRASALAKSRSGQPGYPVSFQEGYTFPQPPLR